ncbi:sensor histidine kinase [Rhodocyclus tenuis]|uniref:histidine kinase n=1 Tax=Rhodocyclus tenuis TaxID=1066 RepID=A0A840G0F6_RHOTE|nr:ATP-binding protein [Rhodocyclus tenuis]MBB4245953.1 signal transduction histidine kinase [Rhodocyclus tenuis]
MGRLFWKFFFFFWLAQLTTGAGIAISLWLQYPDSLRVSNEPDSSPPAVERIDAAAALLRHAGVDALREYLDEKHPGPPRRLLVVDASDHELFGKEVPAVALARARELAAGAATRAVAQVRAPDGRNYLLFVAPREGGAGRPGQPPAPWNGGPPDFIAGAAPAPAGLSAGDPGTPPVGAPGGPPGGPPGGLPMMPLRPLVAGALVSLVFAALLAAYVSRPIGNLRSAFEAVAEGRLDRRVASAMGRRRDELADLGRDFDRMAGRLQTLVDGQRRLLHDVSHEMRSPLARLQAAIGLARQRPERIPDSLVRVEREAVRMDRLVNELLTLSRLEAGMAGAVEAPVALGELLAAVVDDARLEGEAHQCRVELVAPDAATVSGDAELLRRAVENVVRNAVLHSPPGGRVRVELLAAAPGGQHAIVVSDEGPGVAEADLPLIFAPFHRGAAARAAPSPDGHGLGLSIASRVVATHHGEIAAANITSGGLRVTLHLPAIAA